MERPQPGEHAQAETLVCDERSVAGLPDRLAWPVAAPIVIGLSLLLWTGLGAAVRGLMG